MRTISVPGQLSLQPSAPPPLELPWWSRLRAACQHLFNRLAPLGYEDESGFHLGLEPAAQAEERTVR